MSTHPHWHLSRVSQPAPEKCISTGPYLFRTPHPAVTQELQAKNVCFYFQTGLCPCLLAVLSLYLSLLFLYSYFVPSLCLLVSVLLFSQLFLLSPFLWACHFVPCQSVYLFLSPSVSVY